MTDTLLTFVSNLTQVLQEPTSNLAVSALMLAIVILLVLIVIVALLLYLMGPKREKAPEPRAETETTPQPRIRLSPKGAASMRVGLGWLTALLVIGAVVAAAIVTGSRTFCADSCHHGAKVARSDTQGAHAGLSCSACHEHGGPASLGNAVARTGHLLRVYGVGDFRYPSPTPSDSCLRCHRRDTAETTVSARAGVRMSHTAPLAAGMTCAECHRGIGHDETAARTPMSKCIPCHGGATASAECDTCHTGDPGHTAPTGIANGAAGTAGAGRLFFKVKLPPVEECGGCHSQKPCDDCHGIRMPHTRAFRAGGHARQAAFDRKELCWGCHVEDKDCGRCHGRWLSHGPDFA
ncbi:MAG: hypothetical protein C0418_04160, partial [Coriobacteriaceae bacterium]|nr:hypothetical protein [Coriobacteriaceae bacterium]